MDECQEFKTSFRGFSRRDVLQYIDGLRVEWQREREGYQQEVEQLRGQLAEAERRASATPAESAAELALAQDTVRSLRVREQQLMEELEGARHAPYAGREETLEAELAQARESERAASEREAAAQEKLEEAHRALAALWQDKERLEQQRAAALAFVEQVLINGAQLRDSFEKQTMDTEKSSQTDMEQWLF